ncbi:MAG: S24 family peptidase [Bullifex sp.]
MRNMKDIYTLIESEVKKRNINITDFSERIGHNANWFSVCKSRETELRLYDLEKITEVLEIPLSEILYGTGVEFGNPYIGNIPLFDQQLSAGFGEPSLEDQSYGSYITVPKSMFSGYNQTKVKAAKVKGDSMSGINLNSGDIVLFVERLVEGDGIYVINYFNDLYVKRLQFDPFHGMVSIISENSKYKTIECNADNENLIIQGKVISWIHKEI